MNTRRPTGWSVGLPRRLWTRLAVSFVLLFLLTIAVVIALSIIFANRRFDTTLDDQLQAAASTVADRLAEGQEPTLVVEELASAAQFLELLDSRGTPTVRSQNLRNSSLPTFINAGSAPRNDGFHTVTFRRTDMRLIRHPIVNSEERLTGYVVIGTLISDRGENLFDLAAVMISASVVGLAVVVGGAVFVARREAQPLVRLANEVRAATESGFDETVASEGRGSEEARDLRRAFSGLVESQRQLLQRERAFFADSSHVLRTPLAVLKGDIEMLEQGAYGKERQEAVAQAQSAIDAMSRTVTGLLLLAREPARTGSDWVVVELGALLRDVADDAMTAFPGLSVSLESHTSALDAAGNPFQLKDLFISLLENACRYTPAGGSVSVTLMTADSDALVRIEDSGIGFSGDEDEKATDRFFRGAAARRMFPGGSGLGLAIAERIVTLHHGSLTLANRANGGADVTVRLPLIG